MNLATIFNDLQSNAIIYTVMLLIVLDTVLGFLRSCKDKTINSSIGINGLIRKTAIVTVLIVAFFVDYLINFNLIFFIPENILEMISIKEIGILEIFGILFMIFECLSVLKNLDKIGIPIPVKIRVMLEHVLYDMTNETNKEKKQ